MTTLENIIIDPEIKALIPALKPDERAKLYGSIQNEGCRDPLVFWKGHDILLDGHNRYEICQELGQPFQAVEREFPDKDRAMLWILKNQLGRRNLSEIQFELAIARQYELEKKVEGRPSTTKDIESDTKPDQNDQVNSPGETRARIAQEHNISPAKVQRSVDLGEAVKAVHKIAPDVAQKIESGEIKAPKNDIRTLGKALRQAPAEKREQIISELNEDLKKATKTAREFVSPKEAAFQDWANDLQNKTCVGALPKVVVDFFDLQKVKDVLEMQTCPCCGSQTKATLIWPCCGGTIDDAIAAADGAVDRLIEPMKTVKREVRT